MKLFARPTYDSAYKQNVSRYIAAQGPSEETCVLFWEMLWQRDVRMVVMLTNLVEGYGFGAAKCARYWPKEIGQRDRHGEIEVQLYDVQVR